MEQVHFNYFLGKTASDLFHGCSSMDLLGYSGTKGI